MNRNKIEVTVMIFIMVVILVSIMFMRFKAVEESNYNEDSLIQEAEIRKEISTIKDKYETMLQTLNSTNDKIKEYQEQIEQNKDSSELVENELKQTNILLGKTKIKGDGVIITLEDDGENKVLAVDISEIINELKYAGAEAISINGIRINSMTDITEATNKLILINGKRISSPYEVRAIGNQTSLYSTLNAKNGFIEYYTTQYGIKIKMEKQSNIIIEKTLEDVNLKYIKEGEE